MRSQRSVVKGWTLKVKRVGVIFQGVKLQMLNFKGEIVTDQWSKDKGEGSQVKKKISTFEARGS